MQLVQMDFRDSTCTLLEERLALMLLMSLNSTSSVIQWYDPDLQVSFCFICVEDIVRFSTSDEVKGSRAVKVLERQIGKADSTFTAESSLDPGMFIYYMEWDRSNFAGIEELMQSDNEIGSAHHGEETGR